MKRFLSALLLPALLFIAVAARALEPPDVKPGLWQIGRASCRERV